MREHKLTNRAKDDLKDIWHDIARRRDDASAERMTAKILHKSRSHAQFPLTGRSREEWGPGLRSFPVSPYIVVYRPFEDTIQVLRVLHGHRDIERIMSSGTQE